MLEDISVSALSRQKDLNQGLASQNHEQVDAERTQHEKAHQTVRHVREYTHEQSWHQEEQINAHS